MKLTGFKPRRVGQRTKRTAKAVAVTRSLTQNQKLEVKKLVKAAAETKMVTWFSGSSNPLGTGSYAANVISPNWGWEYTNGSIANPVSDVKRVIPLCLAGTGDNQRVGERIKPVSLVVHGNVKFQNANILLQQTPTNYFVVLYVLQHVSLKTYTSLQPSYDTSTPPIKIGGHEFSQLLKTGEGTTINFGSLASEADLPVADEYYKLLKKKVIPLRVSGSSISPAGGSAGPVITSQNCNSATMCARYTLNLTKHVPKVLKYVESNITTTAPGDPTNSSIFFSLGFYAMDYEGRIAQTNIANEYVSIMKFKDL